MWAFRFRGALLTAYADYQNPREDLWDADERWGPWGLGVMICGRMAMRVLASGQGGNRREHRWACRRSVKNHARRDIPQHSDVVWPVGKEGRFFASGRFRR